MRGHRKAASYSFKGEGFFSRKASDFGQAVIYHFSQGVHTIFWNKRPKVAWILWRWFDPLSISVLGHGNALQVEVDLHRHLAGGIPMNGLLADAANFGDLVKVEKTCSVFGKGGRKLHRRICVWVSIRTLRAWKATQFKPDFCRRC